MVLATKYLSFYMINQALFVDRANSIPSLGLRRPFILIRYEQDSINMTFAKLDLYKLYLDPNTDFI
jgi:hypothetical protein